MFYFIFSSSSSFFFIETKSQVAQAGLKQAENDLELLILLPAPLRCWDYRRVSSHPVYVVIRTEQNAELCVC